MLRINLRWDEAEWRERKRLESERQLRVRDDGRDSTLPGRSLPEGDDAVCSIATVARHSDCSHTARAETSIRVVARRTIGHHTLLRDTAGGLKPWKRNRIVTRRTDVAQTVSAAVAGAADTDVFSV